MNYKYQVGGSLTSDAPSYVERSCDRELYMALKAGEFCYVLSSRQMGKSSLLVKTSHHLQQEGYKCTVVDLTNIGSENISPLQWYKGLVTDLLSGFKLSPKINLKNWWQEHEDISLLQRLNQFIVEVLFVEFKQEKIYIFLDEIDSILNLNFSVDDFFGLIRFCYNQRAVNPEYKRLTFAIFGVAAPSDLIKDKKRTPFNIGKSIKLDGFTLDNIQPLTEGLKSLEVNEKKLFQEILAWTGGQPFLTQKVCQLLIHSSSKIVSEALWVENVVRTHIIDKWQSQDDPQHLRTISDRILCDELMAGRLLEVYQQILLGDDVATDNSSEQMELLLSGLVINQHSQLKIKNLIYEAVFNLEWVAKQIENLRPYSQNFKAWIASQQQDESYLLTGTTLQEALAWSYNKKLSDQDYRFLTASQELAKREIEVDLKAEKQARRIEREKSQFALETSRQAYKLLAEARKIAKRKAQTLRLAKNRIISIAGIVASLIILLRIIGLLQGMELTMLDQFFQARPVARIDPRVVIIALDEPDIQQIGQYPVPDQVLVKALQILKSYNPTAIGLDFYRDLPVEPGYKELVEVYKTTPNLIGIEKIVGSAIAPPPVLAQLNQVGFVDQVLDGDGKVRRALLSVQHTNGKLSLSLGLNLALRYLETQGITPKNLPNYKMQIGKAVLIPFLPNDGGFVRADSGGYQILLNFHGIEKQFQIFSITDLLANRIPPNSLRDRIVLIGATAESISDLFQTPYSSRIFDYPHQMAGVTLHANITSHILSAALDGQPVLRVWPEVVEWLWILLWSGVGTLLSWHFQSLRLFTTVTITGVGLTLIAYFAFLQGWWIPHIPPLIGLVVAAVSLPIVITRQLEIIQLRQTVKLLVAAIKEQPTAGQIAIEYLKQAEGQENQLLIEQALQDEI